MLENTNGLVKKKDIAEKYGVTTQTVQQWITAKKYPCPVYRIGPKTFRFDERLVEKWIEERMERLEPKNKNQKEVK